MEVWLKENLERSGFTDEGEGRLFYDSNAKYSELLCVDDVHTTIFFSNFEQYTRVVCSLCVFPLKSLINGSFLISNKHEKTELEREQSNP